MTRYSEVTTPSELHQSADGDRSARPAQRSALDDIATTWEAIMNDIVGAREDEILRPLGDEPGGMPLYTADGWMSAETEVSHAVTDGLAMPHASELGGLYAHREPKREPPTPSPA
jgi:hypothetical protein